MDKIPKLRRKPKPPTIETQIDRTSTDTSESFNSTNAVPISAGGERPSPTTKTKKPSSLKAPFRTFRLRTSGKRARESSPADSSTSSGVALPSSLGGQDGVKVPKSTHSSLEGSEKAPDESHYSDPGPEMPAFLDLSRSDIDTKLNELNWDERIRTLAGQRNDNAEWKWGMYKQADVEEKGIMDRYANIKPWNHNRIKLNVCEGQLDYVNASTITLPSPSDPSRPALRYIAMQGPTEPSIPYVWRMLAEQTESPCVIVQLTTLAEGGVIKCNQYFPDGEEVNTWTLNEDDIWEDGWKATLTLESSEELAQGAIEKRRLSLQVEGEEKARIIWHFLYLRWPDFGVPAIGDLESFFDLMKLSREHSSPTGPRVIHCSAGVGRTGTFMTLEHLIRELDVGGLVEPGPPPTPFEKGPTSRQLLQQQIHHHRSDPIFQTVDLLRQQRRGMVQGEIQYRFIYEVMRKLWQDRHGGFITEDEDEDMTEGGVEIEIENGATPKKVTGSHDPFYEPDRNGEDDDDEGDNDEGGAMVKSSAKTPRG